MKRTESAGGIVLNARDEIALVQNGFSAFWGFPKGHIDEGEDALTAAKREIAEETGLDELTLLGDLGQYERYKGAIDGGDDTSEYKTIRMFLFRSVGDVLAPRDSGNPVARWVKKGEVSGALTNPKDRTFFESVIAKLL